MITATYTPRLRVGAISAVAASAVNSLTPAPAPANGHARDKSVHCVCGAADDHSETDEGSTGDGHIAAAK